MPNNRFPINIRLASTSERWFWTKKLAELSRDSLRRQAEVLDDSIADEAEQRAVKAEMEVRRLMLQHAVRLRAEPEREVRIHQSLTRRIGVLRRQYGEINWT